MTDGLPLPKAFKLDVFPIDKLDPGPDLYAFLSKILVMDYAPIDAPPAEGFTIGLSVAEELVVGLVGLEGFALVLGGAGTSSLTLGVESSPTDLRFRLGAGLRLRFPRDMLKPVQHVAGEWVDDPDRPFGEIAISAGIVIDRDWNVAFDGANAFVLPPVMIADSGFVIEGSVALDFSETTQLPASAALGLPASWRGIVFTSLKAYLPSSLSETVPVASLAFENFHIGSGGVSGTVALNGTPGGGVLAGFPFVPTMLAIELRQNALTGVVLAGDLTLPFFDETVAVDVGFDLDGNLTVGLAGAQDGGLLTLDKPGLLAMQIDGVGFTRQNGIFSVSLDGQLTPKVGGLDWPTFGVDALTIDAAGHVTIEGGGIDLRDQYVLNLYGFQFSISRLGFGTTTAGERWIGFNGGLKLVDGLTAGASVEGMRVIWSPLGPPLPRLTLEGVGVELEIPDVLSFRGSVSMREPEPGVFRFDGDIRLQIVTPELSIDGQLVVGYNRPEDYNFLAIYIAIDLPVGIPLWSTGLGLYGIAGLFALNMEPGRETDEAWYEIPPGKSWYHRDPPGEGVANLRKWEDAKGSLGLGAGITLGTVMDNGYTFSGRMLLAIVFPGPIIMVEGRADVLQSRSGLDDEPVFRTLLVIDGREGTLTAGLDARYAISDNGELIDLHGSMELFFDFEDFTAWHLHLGVDEPRERRIGGDIFFRIFHADTYFMIDAHRVKTGAWTGIEKNWKFGPLRIAIEAWIEGKSELSFKPPYFQNQLALHGGFAATVFGFGFHLGATATLHAGVFDPFRLRANLHVSIGLPWPLPDFDVDFSLEWPSDPTPPLLPLLLKELALGHDIVSTTWPLPAGTLLLPDMDNGAPVAGFFDGHPPALADADMPPPGSDAIPVVPMDARPEVTFGRAVHDDAFVGSAPQPQYVSAVPAGWSRIGNPAANQGPALIRPALANISLDRWTGLTWEPVAGAGTSAPPAKLYGSWMPTPSEPGGGTGPGQAKLRLWSKTPFSFTRHTGSAWTDNFVAQYPAYPCIDVPKNQRICCDFAALVPGERPAPPWRCKGNDAFAISWTGLPRPRVKAHGTGVCLSIPPGGQVTILLTGPVQEVMVEAVADEVRRGGDRADFTGRRPETGPNPRVENRLRFTAYVDDNRPAEATRVDIVRQADGSNLSGLMCDNELHCILSSPASRVSVIASCRDGEAVLVALDAAGRPLDKRTRSPNDVGEIVLHGGGEAITRVDILSRGRELTFLHEIAALPVSAREALILEAVDGAGTVLERKAFVGRVAVNATGAAHMVVRAPDGRGFCLVRVCALVGPSARERTSYEAHAAHAIDELARWQDDDDVLPPYTTFRLKTVSTLDLDVPAGSPLSSSLKGQHRMTHVGYFRTEGPPGLAALVNAGSGRVPGAGSGAPDTPPALETGLEDLSRYVAQTIPPTIATEGVPVLPRPVYRGYDVGVDFKINYVDLMYSLAGRDLALALFDMNDRPVRDGESRVLTTSNQWGRTDTLSLSDSDRRWVEMLDAARCTRDLIDLDAIAHNKATSLDGFVLDPATTYEARLLPHLAVETFDSFPLGLIASGTGARLAGASWTWIVRDEGVDGGPSDWRIGESGTPADRHVEQLADISAGPASRDLPFPGGTLLLLDDVGRLAATHPDQPSRWTDYRLSGFVRSSDEDIVGFGVRMIGRTGYLLKLDRRRNRQELELVTETGAQSLASRPGGFVLDSDIAVSIEVAGSRLRVHIDGRQAFDVEDETRSAGTVALYAANNAAVRFTEVRVHDLRPTAPIAYRFKFTTSDFADLRHHLASGDDETRAMAATAAALAAATVVAVDPAGSAARVPAGEAEARANDSVALAALGPAARQRVNRVEAMRLTDDAGATVAILLRVAEPINWSRTTVSLAVGVAVPPPLPAKGVRLTAAAFAEGAAPDPRDEAVALTLLDAASLTGHAIERRILPSPAAPSLEDGAPLWSGNFLTSEDMGDDMPAILWAPPLDDITAFDLVVPAHGSGVAHWIATGGVLRQTGSFTTPDDMIGGTPGTRPARGTLAIGPMILAANIGVAATLHVKPGGAGGLVFRYQDNDNYYRVAIDRRRKQRVLSRFVGGKYKALQSVGLPLSGNGAYDLRIDAFGGRIRVWIDGILVFNVVDGSLAVGRVGFYAQANAGLRVEDVRVARISQRLGDWHVDDQSPAGDRAVWRIVHGTLVKEPVADGSGESVAVITGGNWADVRITTLCMADGGIAGPVWRYASIDDHMRLELDLDGQAGRIVARRGGTDATIWAGALPPQLPSGGGQRLVTIEAIGRRVRLLIDGTATAEVEDAGAGSGSVGAFAAMSTGSALGPFTIAHAVPAWEGWHRFGEEPHRVSGRHVRVTASVAPADTSTPGEDARWKNLPAAGFQRGLPLEGIDLRIVDPAGHALHGRRFHRPSAFTPTQMRLVRAADDTALIVLPVAGALPAGELRMDWSYRRDNGSIDPSAQILRQSGSSAPETFALLIA